jgi:hypothetical protein
MSDVQGIGFNVEIPDKYEVVPLHNSDRGSFRRCREYWNWSSPARQNLTIRADVHGINLPLWFGTGIHYALEQHYSPAIMRSPVEAWKTWFDIQWRGGIVTEEWLDRVYDLNPKEVDIRGVGGTWQVRGLEDILPDPQHEEFDELFILGTEMMTFYERYAKINDDFDVLLAEHTFSIPIWDYENDKVLTRVDIREESPNYGKELEVHARGRVDAVKRRVGTERLGIVDHKTTAKVEENLPVILETDEQCTSYLYALEIEAQYYDLPHKGEPMEEVLFNVLRKAYPKPPTILKDGYSFSLNRLAESTTYEMLMEYIESFPQATKEMLWPRGFNEKQQEYINYLRDVGDEQFVLRFPVRRNRHQLANAGYRMYLEAMDMLDPNVRIYPNQRNDWKCLNCQFRAPCIAKMDGSDWEQLIRDNYTTAKDR